MKIQERIKKKIEEYRKIKKNSYGRGTIAKYNFIISELIFLLEEDKSSSKKEVNKKRGVVK